MPDLSQLPVPKYQADQPYHWEYDNVPLDVLAQRDEIINGEVEAHSRILHEAIGSQGTLGNRLNQSIDADGNLKPSAVDEANHNVASHYDGQAAVAADELSDYIDLGYPGLVNPVKFVRMLGAERDKLAEVADQATNLTLGVQTASNVVHYEGGAVELAESSSIRWEVEAPNRVRAVLVVSTDFAHRHYYNLTPVSIPTTDTVPVLRKLYKVTSTATPYIEGSLRVCVNGTTLNPSNAVLCPNATATVWTANRFTPDHAAGRFTMLVPLSAADVVTVDFDVSLT